MTQLSEAANLVGKRRRTRAYDAGSDADFVSYLEEYMVPVGTLVKKFSDKTPGDAWVLAVGQPMSKVDYADLYADMGGIFGENATSFNMPDFSGKTSLGQPLYWFIKTRL